MTLPDLFTRLAIGVLVVGTPLVFVWFLRDLPAMLGRGGEDGGDPSGDASDDSRT